MKPVSAKERHLGQYGVDRSPSTVAKRLLHRTQMPIGQTSSASAAVTYEGQLFTEEILQSLSNGQMGLRVSEAHDSSFVLHGHG